MHLAARAFFGILLLSNFLTSTTLAADSSAQIPKHGERFPMAGTVIVKFQNNPVSTQKVGIRQVDAVLEAHGLESMQPIATFATPRKAGGVDLSRVHIVRYASGVSPSYLARQLAELPGVEYAEPKWVHWITVAPNDPWWAGTESAYMTRMQFDPAWDLVKGEDGNVVVAVVDGGTDWNHRDLLGNIWLNPGETPGNGLDDDGNGFIDDLHGWNFGNNSADPTGLVSTRASAQHGTHVGGIVSAIANNATDVTGGSWNATLMPIATGVEGVDGAIGFGYEGILYAADNGADIINCSWGGQGAPSTFELETIEWAMDQGALVVAAAGNQNSPAPHYPSSYPPVLSVANLTNTDTKNSGSNYGVDVDVSAQGTAIRSTFPGNLTNVLTGTSMSSPHVAAIAALVKTKWPGYTPRQVRERVRVTCDNIDNINFGFQLGRGRVNALRALTDNTPAIRISSVEVLDADGDGTIEPGELLTVKVSVTNYLAGASGLSFTMTENSAAASMVDGISFLTSIDSMQTLALSPYEIQIAAGAPEQTSIQLTIDIASSPPLVYFDEDHFEITVLPVFVNHTGNNVQTSVTSNGRMGFALSLGGNSKDGIGFKYKNGSNLLFEGSLLIGDSQQRVIDSARGAVLGSQELEFRSSAGGTPTIDDASALADQVSNAQFNDDAAAFPMNIDVLQQAFQFSSAPDDDYIIIKHTITNRSAGTLNGVRVGHYFDWDIDGGTFFTNRTAYDATRGLGYVWDNTGGANGTYIGMMALNPEGTTSFKGIWNNHEHANNPDWGVFDGFTTAEKWDALTEGFALSNAGPEDISTVVATGPFNSIAPDQDFSVTFAFLAGDNLSDLQANADAAIAKWAVFGGTTPVAISDFRAILDTGDVLLRWRTEREENVAAFRILRSRDGAAFEAIGHDVALQLSGDYSFRDAQPLPGEYTYRIAEVGLDGSIVLHQSTHIAVTSAAPLRTFLAPNTPNPFNPQTTLQYGLSSPGPVRLVVYDSRGRRVKTLLQENWMLPGEYHTTWNGTDDQGRPAASGVYFARLELPGRALLQRMTLLK